MNLTFREGGIGDIPRCHELLSLYRHTYDDAAWAAVPGIWREWLRNNCVQIFLVQDLDRPTATRVVSFSLTVFVTDAFAAEARKTLGPYLGYQVTRRVTEGHSPVLEAEQIARANSDGTLNTLMCQGGWEQRPWDPMAGVLLGDKLMEAFYYCHRGFQLKELMMDPYGDDSLHWVLSGGFRLRRDYAPWFAAHGLPLPPPPARPWLVSLTREEALVDVGARAAAYFVPCPARLHFSPAEKDLLRHALSGQTDEELAESLLVSPWTVKKRWRGIYERVQAVAPELLPEGTAPGAAPGDASPANARGSERRRHLLNHLRYHLEELRPTAADTTRDARANGSPRPATGPGHFAAEPRPGADAGQNPRR